MHFGKIKPTEYAPGGQGVQDNDPAREVEPRGHDVQFRTEPFGMDHVPSEADRDKDTCGPKAPDEQDHMYEVDSLCG